MQKLEKENEDLEIEISNLTDKSIEELEAEHKQLIMEVDYLLSLDEDSILPNEI